MVGLPAEVAVRIDDYYTASSAAAPAAHFAHVVYLGVVSTVEADNELGEPEPAVDLAAAGSALGRARKVAEHGTSPVNTRSPFGM